MNVHSFSYNTAYPGPPFPVVELVIAGTHNAPRETLALIDSGADATLIPLSILNAVGARKIDSRWARNISGIRYRVSMFTVDLSIGSYSFPNTEVIANVQTDEVVVGRDVLNQLILLLNGLAQVVEVSR